MTLLPSCKCVKSPPVSILHLACLFVLLGIAVLPIGARADRLFGGDVLVSDLPVGTTHHGTYNSGQRNVTVRNDTVHIMWAGNGLWYSRSIDGGVTFGADTEVDTGVVAGSAINLCLGRDGTLYAVWYDRREGDGSMYNIYFTKSTNGGDSFGSVVRVDDSGTDSSWQLWPAVAVDDSGRIYVVWLDGRGNGGLGVYASRSTDGGASFDSSVALPNTLGFQPYPQEGPSIAAKGDGEVYVAYLDYFEDGPGYMSLAVRRSTDGGQTYSDPAYVAEYLNISVQATSIALGGSTDVYVAWPDEYPCLAKSDDCGQAFGPMIQVSDLRACCVPPERRISLSVNSSGWIGVAWRNYYDTVAFSESRDGGSTFLPAVLFSGTGYRGGASATMDDSLNVYLAWTDDRHSAKGDIYFAKGILDPPAGVDGSTSGPRINGALPVVKPNPFKATVTVWLGSANQRVKAGIYDLQGRLIRELVGREGTIIWDGLDEGGIRVSPGIYFCRIEAAGAARTCKMIRAR